MSKLFNPGVCRLFHCIIKGELRRKGLTATKMLTDTGVSQCKWARYGQGKSDLWSQELGLLIDYVGLDYQAMLSAIKAKVDFDRALASSFE